MNRVLIVDPDARASQPLVEELARAGRWQGQSVQDPAEVLPLLASQGYGAVVVADRGAQPYAVGLLEQIQTSQPGVLRLLVAPALRGVALERALTVAQRWERTLPSADWIDAWLTRPVAPARNQALMVRSLVGRLDALPGCDPAPPHWDSVFQGGAVPETVLAELIALDPALTLRLLALANTGAFGTGTPVQSIHEAVRCLGPALLRELLVTNPVALTSGEAVRVRGFSLPHLHSHLLLTARLARVLVDDPQMAETAFTAGLIHDLGRLALAAGMHNRYALVLRHAERSDRRLFEVEESFVGVRHDVVGAWLAHAWGLPDVLIDAIGAHHADQPGLDRHAVVVRAVQRAQRAAECHERQRPLDESTGLTADEAERVRTELRSVGTRRRAILPELASLDT